MLKKGFILFVLISMFSNTFAGMFHGFYLGAQGGFLVGTYSFDRTNQSAGNPTDISNQGVSDQSFMGGGYLGYAGILKHYYLAVEAHYSINSLSITNNNNNLLNTIDAINWVRLPNSYGLSIHPGYLFGLDSLLYGILGLSSGRITFRDQIDNDPIYYEYTRHLIGYQLGLGFAVAIQAHLLLRLAYTYTIYTRFTRTVADPTNLEDSFLHRLRTHQFLLGLSFFFA